MLIYIFIHNFFKRWPIFKIILPPWNLQQNSCDISLQVLNVSLHYFAKLNIWNWTFSLITLTKLYIQTEKQYLKMLEQCIKRQTASERHRVKPSAADMFDLQQVTVGARGCIRVEQNGPDQWDQWRILRWGAFDSKATACHAWDLWRVLYLPARQCSYSPKQSTLNLLERQTPAFISTDLPRPTAQTSIWLTTKFGENAAAGLPNESLWHMSMNWSSD